MAKRVYVHLDSLLAPINKPFHTRLVISNWIWIGFGMEFGMEFEMEFWMKFGIDFGMECRFPKKLSNHCYNAGYISMIMAWHESDWCDQIGCKNAILLKVNDIGWKNSAHVECEKINIDSWHYNAGHFFLFSEKKVMIFHFAWFSNPVCARGHVSFIQNLYENQWKNIEWNWFIICLFATSFQCEEKKILMTWKING